MSNLPKGRCYGNQLINFRAFADVEVDRLYSLLWRPEKQCLVNARINSGHASIHGVTSISANADGPRDAA